MNRPRKIADFIYDVMKKHNLKSIYVGEFGFLHEAYDNYLKEVNPKVRAEHPIAVLEACMRAIRRSDRFMKRGEIKHIYISDRESWHPIYKIKDEEVI